MEKMSESHEDYLEAMVMLGADPDTPIPVSYTHLNLGALHCVWRDLHCGSPRDQRFLLRQHL